MKQIVEARYNVLFLQDGSEKTLKLNPECEIIIIHTDGKKYVPVAKNRGFRVEQNLSETRMFVSPSGLDELIQGLQRIRMTLKNLENVTEVVNDVFSTLTTTKPPEI
jgi:hypothetical protein